MAKKKKQPENKWQTYLQRAASSFAHYPHFYAFGAMLLYLLVFQFQFVTTGDGWAEAFYEYIHGALVVGREGFFDLGIAGYFNFLPKLLTYPYIWLNFPLEYIDYFYRFMVILFTLACVSFIAHPYNRDLIKNDLLRTFLAFAVLLTFYHISSFSMINVWYVGFIPIILVSLSPHKFQSEWHQIFYATFTMAVCLTKPSLVVLPLIIYRLIRHKEILLGSILLFPVLLQACLFFTSSYYAFWSAARIEHVTLLSKIVNTLLYPGLLVWKLYQVAPAAFAFVAAGTGVIGMLFAVFWKVRGFIQAALLGLVLCLASYSAIYPPDSPPFSVQDTYTSLFGDYMKLQREVLISFVIVLLIFVCASFVIQHFAKHRHSRYITIVTFAIVIILTAMSFRVIDAKGSHLYVNLDPFRPSLAKDTPICMPVAPTPSWYPPNTSVYGWYYESWDYGTCGKTNYDKSIDYHSFGKQKINRGTLIKIVNVHHHDIKSLYLPVQNPDPTRATTLVLKNTKTGKTYEAPIDSKKNDKLTFVAFNLEGEDAEDEYSYQLSEKDTKNSALSTGTFTDGRLAHYSYFLPKELPKRGGPI